MSAARGAASGGEIAARQAPHALAEGERALAGASDTPRLDAEVLLALVTGRTRSSLLAFAERPIEAGALARFAALVERRARGEPLAYLTGTREFFSLDLAVTPSVLVPRPETELLVERVVLRCRAKPAAAVLDVGTGSGAIALAVKRECAAARVTGIDASAAALEVAQANGARYGLEVRWRLSHWLDALRGERFDVIVSNPPYVRSAEVRGALDFEPRVALDGGVDGLDAYRVLFATAAELLAPEGSLVVEHGAEQRPALVALATEYGWRVVGVHDDLAGRARVLELEVAPRART